MDPIFRTSANEMKAELLDFNNQMPKVSAHETLLVPKGQKTQGGLSNAEGYLDNLLAKSFAPLPTTMREVVVGAIDLARGIVAGHVFYDGNGRTCLYAIYFWCANFGIKITIKPIALHALILKGEEGREGIPARCVEPLITLAVPAQKQQLSSFLLKKKRELRELEDLRKRVVMAGDKMDRSTHLSAKRGLAGTYTRVQQWMDCRSADTIPAGAHIGSEQDIAKRTFMELAGGLHASPDGVRLVESWMAEITAYYGHAPTSNEVKDWMRAYWVD